MITNLIILAIAVSILIRWHYLMRWLKRDIHKMEQDSKKLKGALGTVEEIIDLKELIQTAAKETFYEKHLMPCCGKEIKYQEGPSAGSSTNIRCAHCKHRWNICPPYFIEDIDE